MRSKTDTLLLCAWWVETSVQPSGRAGVPPRRCDSFPPSQATASAATCPQMYAVQRYLHGYLPEPENNTSAAKRNHELSRHISS